MHYQDSKEQALFRQKAQIFLKENAKALSREKDRFKGGLFLQKNKFEKGFACLSWPKEFGGQAAPKSYDAIFEEEQAKFPDLFDAVGIGVQVCAPTLMKYLDKEKSARYLPKIASGEEIWCQLFSEPSAGSDLAGLSTKAVKEGKKWVISGQKTWTSIAHKADFGLLLARTDSSLPKHQGLTAFILDMRAEGVKVLPIKQMTGDEHFNQVYLDKVVVDDANRLGEIGQGWQVALTTLKTERGYLGNQGSIKTCDCKETLRLAKETPYKDQRAIDYGGFRERLADLYVKEAGLKLTKERFRVAFKKDEEPSLENSVCKYVKGDLANEAASLGMDILGTAGLSFDPKLVPDNGYIQMSYLRSLGAKIAGGTDEIQLNILAERVLHMPKDIRIDKDIPFKNIPKGPQKNDAHMIGE